ncbi:MAG: DivIVA domain-containing protein, partial [Aeriscardovia sp.]|nr:DivIVA domain-containing protein [Aeriscardovia sp.]
MALLTPNDIRNHRFNTTRFREGYDIDEVDSFLDEVTETIDALSSNAMGRSGAAAMLEAPQGDDKSKELEDKNKELEDKSKELEDKNKEL